MDGFLRPYAQYTIACLNMYLQCIKGVYFETAVSGLAVPSKMDIVHPNEQLAYTGLGTLVIGR